MFELTKECDKHPERFLGLGPEDFSERFLSVNYVWLKDSFDELSKEYKIQSISDWRKGRVQLSSGLGNLVNSCYLVSKEINENFGEHDFNFLGLNAEDFSRAFGFTNYFYQRECFKLIKDEMPTSFDSVLKSIDLVCKACEKYMNNPFE